MNRDVAHPVRSREMTLRVFKSTRWRFFFSLLGAACLSYLVDCLVAFDKHPELPWYKTGIYALSPLGFWATGLCAVCAILYLAFGKDR